MERGQSFEREPRPRNPEVRREGFESGSSGGAGHRYRTYIRFGPDFNPYQLDMPTDLSETAQFVLRMLDSLFLRERAVVDTCWHDHRDLAMKAGVDLDILRRGFHELEVQGWLDIRSEGLVIIPTERLLDRYVPIR